MADDAVAFIRVLGLDRVDILGFSLGGISRRVWHSGTRNLSANSSSRGRNGDNDRMVPTVNTEDLGRRIPGSELIIYPDAGHGGIFQHHRSFVAQALEFLGR
jgi:pimeloyl-ACP methyl ester carboxylesterase